MKKLFYIGIIVIFFFPLFPQAHAQTITSTPTPTPEVVPPDSTNVIIKQNQSWSSLLQLISHTFSLSPANNTYTSAKDIQGIGQQLQQSGNDFMPADVKTMVTPDPNPKQQTITSVGCIRNPLTGKLEQVSGNDAIQTQDIPGLSGVESGSRVIAQDILPGYTQTTQDYTVQNIVVGQGTCDDSTPTGEPVKPANVGSQNQTSVSGSSIVSLIETFLSNIVGGLLNNIAEVQIQGKSVTPGIATTCLLGRCTADDVKSVTDPNKNAYLQPGGGIADTFRPANVDYKGAFDSENDTQQWSLSDANTGSNVQGAQSDSSPTYNIGQANIVNAGTFINCSILPADAQPAECNRDWSGSAPSTSCNAAMPDLSISDSSCKLCDPGSVTNISPTFFPNGVIPPTMVKILEKAGETYHVPPKMLLLTLFSEAGMPQYMGGQQWTEDNVKNWSFCGQTMPFCNTTTSAAYPYGMLAETFNRNYINAVDKVDPNRAGHENLCNFMDQTFAVAKMLSDSMDIQLPADITKYNSCLNVPVAGITSTKTDTSCNWSETDMFRARLMYMTYCPESGKNGSYKSNDQMLNWTHLFSSNFKCQ